MRPGERDDGRDAHAIQLHDRTHWPLRVVIAVVQRGPKKVGSTEGMEHTRDTSPYFGPWIESVPPDLDAARRAILTRDFDALTRVAERSALRMHASAIAADPGVLYWRGATVELIRTIRAWRDEGIPCFFTIDAGPHIKVFCRREAAVEIERRLRQRDDVVETIVCEPGRGAHRIVSLDDPTPLPTPS